MQNNILTNHVFKSNEVKAIEAIYAQAHHGSCFDLMQRAGRAVFEKKIKTKREDINVWIFVGKGNNGGDGYIVASLLDESNIQYRVFALGEPKEGTEAYLAYEYYLSIGGKIENSLPNYDENPPDIIVDALLGTGLNSAPKSPCDEWILFINRMRTYTISIDVPSGVDADTGNVPGDCVKASVTVCMLALKIGLLTSDALDYVGRLVFANLQFNVANFWGNKSPLYNETMLPIRQKQYIDIIEDLPVRSKNSHKGDSGKVLAICGSLGTGGAACLCAMGALRCGAGLVKVATFKDNITAINAYSPELMTIDYANADMLRQGLNFADVIAIGPGLGVDNNAILLVDSLSNIDKHVIYDADALNLIAKGYVKPNKKCILTPHPLECARLLNVSLDYVAADRVRACSELQHKYGGIALLKGAGTIVCDGKFITIINEGSAAMATGGMGDVLTGMIASLIAQGLNPRDAVVSAACIHGRAGFLAGQEHGMIGTIASDLFVYIHKLVNNHV